MDRDHLPPLREELEEVDTMKLYEIEDEVV